ncbi:histidine kinase [Cavenderia fasciculata]|uniref:Histidine kinase n=1 Tax=Cavenderia fasciculata TaxID=261658 RepID=F4PUZ5_CACFS|nr:histidine kinase [Cavenderia fasciculata]EGG21111.1 histidine kinase [Cavenderia fasciculata]|eukprot:XP_004358961.1 histidine kinase [Cavenderia fasciculata]
MNVAASACVTGDKVNVEVYINRGTVADKDLEPLEASPNILSPVLKSFSFLNIQPPNQYQQHSSSSSSSSTQQPLSLSQSQQQMEEFNKAIRDDGNWNLCSSMINYVQRTQSPLLISNAADDKTFSDDPYVKFQRPKSVLVLPIVHQGKLVSILYLENNFTTGAFTSGRMEVLNLLSTQIAVSFQNARLFLQTNHLANQAFLAKEEAERANKAKSDFISNMSHEMRTPLNHIIGSLELLQTFPLSSDQKELLSISQQSSESLLFMVNNILDLSKVEQGKTVLNYTSFNLVSFLEENIGAIANNAHQKGLMVGMYCYPCTSEVPVIGDKNLLRQVLVNLLSNAIKFTSKGEVFVKVNITPNTIDTTKINLNEKSLTPTLRSQQKQLQQIHQQQQHQQQQQLSTEVPPTTTFNLLSVNQDSSNSNSNSNSNSPYLGSANNNNSTTTQIKSYSIFIEVRDSGIGIKQRDFDKLFQRFSQIDSGVNRAYDGSGLGLSICKQLIELMNGEIGINSKIGEGSIFHFSLEMAKPPSEHIKPSGELSLFRDNTNIIILEDNKTIRGQIEEAISSFGIKQINSSTFSNINLSLYLSSSDDFLLAKNNNIIIIGLPLNYNEDHVMNLIDNINLIKERSASNNLDIKVDFVVITQLALTSSKSMLQECGILLVNRPIKRDALLKTLADLTREQTIGRSYSQQNIHQHLGSGNQHHHHSFNRSHSPIGQLVNSPTIKRSVSSPKLGVIVTDDNNCHQFAPPPLRSREKEALSFLDLNKSPPISPIIKQPPQHHLLNNAPLVNGASSPTIQLPILVKKRAPNVLVIEDNELNAIILFKMLEKIGITNPDSAINGVEGVEKASNGNYDLILMDIQMPVMDGYEATNRIRQLEGSIKHTPIVAMTANAMGGQREACLRAGCDDYFCKPLKQKDLEQVIKKFLNYDDYLILLKQQQEHAATILQQQQQQQNIVTPSS